MSPAFGRQISRNGLLNRDSNMSEGLTTNSTRRGQFFAYAPLILWIAVILILGSSSGSMAQTSRFIRPLIEFFFPSASPDTFLLVHAFIRKTAHFVEYAILAYLAQRAFSRSTGRSLSGRPFTFALVLVVIVAILDELNQSFIGSRTSSPYDVLLDILGGGVMLVCVLLLRRPEEAIRLRSGRKRRI